MEILTEEFADFAREWENPLPYICAHTSGSTGAPKEVRLLKSDMLRSAEATCRFFRLDSGSTLFCPLAARYIAGKMMLVRSRVAGCSLITVAPSAHPLGGARRPLPGVLDMVCVVPAQVESLLSEGTGEARLRSLIVGGAPLSAELERRLAQAPWQSYVTYGMTETCSHVALRRVGEDLYHALLGISFSTDDRGCLIIDAPAFSYKQLTTNDVVELQDDSSFRWLGRADYTINSGGVKLHPEQLERLIDKELAVPFFFRAMPHPRWGEAVEMVVERGEATPSETELYDLCRRLLPKYAVPSAITFVDSLPYNANGKLCRKQPLR